MVFVTGATGLLGSHLLYFLCKNGYEVCALRRAGSDINEVKSVFEHYPSGLNLWTSICWVEGDVLDIVTLEEKVASAQSVYHCAAMVSFSGGDKSNLLNTNLRGTENITSLCLKYGVRLGYVSSIGALGDARHEKEFIDEETPVIAGSEHSVYSQSKLDSENIVWNAIAKGLNAVIVNPAIILGSGHWHRSSSQLYTTAAKGMPFYTQGIVGYVDVRDVCMLLIRLVNDAAVSGERYILNGGNHSYKELFTQIAQATGKRLPWLSMKPWMTEFAWRLLALIGKMTGKQPAFTKETARSSQHKSYYSTAKIAALYPDYSFFTLAETIHWITMNSQGENEN
ncbi:NAD-dependent epimerase/dehydratase family protein [Odoribacter sp. OttesenSCG-928-A06]|nr:NAD-dependent epimerase/dehydratase family protein [Odoribacter sp. OttesenSCG-928-A06]